MRKHYAIEKSLNIKKDINIFLNKIKCNVCARARVCVCVCVCVCVYVCMCVWDEGNRFISNLYIQIIWTIYHSLILKVI